jgi:DNA repair protein RecN (Recombination protein N)
MLTFLQIRDYAIIDALDLDVCEGFTCITGETGAGKSILVGALGLLSGDRADTGAIRTGAERAELSAGFELPEDSPALAWLRDNDLDEDGSCLLRRTMASNGRSRAWINGIAVTLQQLAGLGDLLIEIHGQNEHLRLARAEEQFRLLDSSGAHAQELQDVHRCCETWRTLAAEREALLAEKPLDAGEQDLLQYQVRELENEALSADEFSQLESEHRMLARGGELLEELEAAARTLDAEPSGAARTLHRAADRLGPHGALDRDIAAAAALLREAAINCDEALGSVQAALGRLDLSPDRLSDLERKLGVQHDLARKHRVQPEQLHQVLEDLRGRLERAGSLEQRLDSLERDLELALDAYREAAAALHARRTERAAELSEAVTALMPQLGMEGGSFSVQVRLDGELQAAPRGSDRGRRRHRGRDGACGRRPDQEPRGRGAGPVRHSPGAGGRICRPAGPGRQEQGRSRHPRPNRRAGGPGTRRRNRAHVGWPPLSAEPCPRLGAAGRDFTAALTESSFPSFAC